MFRALDHGYMFVLRSGVGVRRDTTTPSGRRLNWNQFSQPHQIVGRCREGEDPPHFENAAMFQFAQQGDVFQPAETLLDPLAFLLTLGIAGVPRGAPIDGAAAPSAVVLRHMRRNVHPAAFLDELPLVETLVAATVMRPLSGIC